MIKKSIFFKTSNDNDYFYNLEQMQFFFMHPIMRVFNDYYSKYGYISNDILNNENIMLNNYGMSKNLIKYYLKKYQFYIKHSLIDKTTMEHKISWENMSSQLMKYQVINTKVLLFEVTERCNLDCYYCGYNELYNQDEYRNKHDLSFEDAKLLIDELINVWSNNIASSSNKIIHVGFYGGEPLLNMRVIKKIVEYLIQRKNGNIVYKFRMTTNAVLLVKYIEYLIKYDFNLLISFDGDENANSCRVFKNSKASFNIVTRNIHKILQKYPEYFDKNISFNSVLTSKTTFLRTLKYIKSNYGKIPNIASLAGSNVNKEKKTEYENLYLNKDKSYLDALREEPTNEYLNKSVYVPRLENFLKSHLKLRVFNINEILYRSSLPFIRARGCLPFSLKIFLSSRGNLLPCEKIDAKFSFGNVHNTPIFNYEFIARQYKKYLDNLTEQCQKCYRAGKCGYCLFLSDEINSKLVCPEYMGEKKFSTYFSNQFSKLENLEEIIYGN